MAKIKLSNGNYAAIDIGSNAVRLLIKRIGVGPDGPFTAKEQLIRVPLRLGFDVFTKGYITKRKGKKLCKLIGSFVELMKLYEVLDFKACATSAIRDAANGTKVIAMIKKKTGVKIHILSGQEEAKFIYNTHAEFIHDANDNRLYVDVGGGSTEVNMMVDSRLIFTNSYDIGTIRVLSDTVDPGEWERMENDLADLAKAYPNTDILGSGGNINKLYRLVENRDKKQQRMTVDSLRKIHMQMGHLSMEERIKQYNLKYDRADVIVPACLVFLTIADLMGSKFIYVPTIGLSDGILDDLIFKKMYSKKKKSEHIPHNKEDVSTIKNEVRCGDDNSCVAHEGENED